MESPIINRVNKINHYVADHFWLDQFEAREFKSGKKELNYRFFQPTEGTGPYPLVLWLHGLFGRGDHNESQIKAGHNSYGPAYFSHPDRQKEFPCYVLAPQCPSGRLWIKFRNNTSTRYLRWVMDLLAEIQDRYEVDPSRIYVAGQSMGGFATWVLLAEYPHRFAGAIPICGGAPHRKLKRRMETPVWAFHGDKDKLVRPWRTRLAVKASEHRDVEVKFTYYADSGHFIGPKVFAEPELESWLFSHSR